MPATSSTASTPLSPAALPDQGIPAHLDTSELRRAIKHHRRAISALEGVSFTDLPDDISRSLLKRLQRDLRTLESELKQRSETKSRAA